MRQLRSQLDSHTRRRRGFSLVESVIAVLLVGLLMVASLRSLGASKRREVDTMNRVLGQQLANDLMNEILLQTYQEPDAAVTPVFGLEPGESTGHRSLFDDVDDFAGWTSTPPKNRSGAEIPGFSGWTQSANVIWVDPITLSPTAAKNTGLKKMTVTVAKNGKSVASLVGYRSIAWVDTIPLPTDATGNNAPVAVATAPGSMFLVGQTVTLDGSSSTDQDGDKLSYVWTFGDGTSGAGRTATKVYSTTGFFTITLTVYDGRGGTATVSLVVFVGE